MKNYAHNETATISLSRYMELESAAKRAIIMATKLDDLGYYPRVDRNGDVEIMLKSDYEKKSIADLKDAQPTILS